MAASQRGDLQPRKAGLAPNAAELSSCSVSDTGPALGLLAFQVGILLSRKA